MRYVLIVFLLLAFLVLNYCLLVPTVNPGLSWEEAGLGLAPSAFVALICFVMLVSGVGAKADGGSRATLLWALALVWGLIVGGIVIVATMDNRAEQTGMFFGIGVLAFAGISLIGLILSLVMRKKNVRAAG